LQRLQGEKPYRLKDFVDTKKVVILLQEVEGRGDLREGGDGI